MNVLAIDTSTFTMSVAVFRDGLPAGELTTHLKKNHSLRLMPAIRAVMAEADMKPEELDRIAVAEGPGSYTGVRIGVTTAKTMAWSLNIPVVGVSSLEALAANGRHFEGLVCPFFDARRGQVFTGLYRFEDGETVRVEEDRLVMFEEWLETVERCGEPVLFLSPDLAKHEGALGERSSLRAGTGAPVDHLTRASGIASAAMKKAADEAIHLFSPNYLRLAEAEAKWREAQKEKDGR
ncbi:tRNA (adenosine(37)-N6)-threonylcarbamoyltransferase complex dimerization subunit type 1 TsaB [Alteribacter natronophilus]|uniref:tRNA (adenosine(37)-N6)-threonylcarbamoyltransferase complex dimerization subunit type 1 TsaB n=1 Tax=Alteribacter natronophilus TaxID=2583810 RepID=UPI00110D8F64|nr:tRNA (adenosine(37)-N6)-threonylcarbamoyltransferase complex dimerization subunit type 1 TsaB [Alteribacter natronophilus]TMW70874.1 tRNA (adenosine(37)-N6)-threonylcarbamoyltransferase complex dimerization subunit type 1 TsaB [Alteribacter natronophilus]